MSMKKYNVSVYSGKRYDIEVEAPNEETARKIVEIMIMSTNALEQMDAVDSETDIEIDPFTDEPLTDDYDDDMDEPEDILEECFTELREDAEELSEALDKMTGHWIADNADDSRRIHMMSVLSGRAYSAVFDLLDQLDELEDALDDLTDAAGE